MFGPKPKGFWSGVRAPNAGSDHDSLRAGRKYRVIREFRDYDHQLHAVGETWEFCGFNFVPYDDGMSFFVSPDGKQEWHLRLQWRPEGQGAVLDNLAEYISPDEA